MSLQEEGRSGLKGSSRHSVERFTSEARAMLGSGTLDATVEVFYWLSRCAYGSGQELDDDTMLAYSAYIRSQALMTTETMLIRVLRTMFAMMNRNKIMQATESDAQMHLDRIAHELLDEALPRLCARHMHLTLRDLGSVLAVYAKMYRPAYRTLYTSLKGCMISHACMARVTVSPERSWAFFENGPFVLVACAQARFADEELFDAYLRIYETSMSALTYENVAVLAYAVSHAEISRPRFWSNLVEQLGTYRENISSRSLGLLCGASRKLLLSASTPADVAGCLELHRAVGSELARRARSSGTVADELGFMEAADLLISMALLPPGHVQGEPVTQEMLSASCELALRFAPTFPPSYLAGGFHAITAMVLLEVGPQAPLVDALAALTEELRFRLMMCDPEHLELMAVAMYALLARKPELFDAATLADGRLGEAVMLPLVLQREAIRKARLFNPGNLAGFSCLVTRTAAMLEQVVGDGIRRDWFIPSILDFLGDAGSGTSAPSSSSTSASDRAQLEWLSGAMASPEGALASEPPAFSFSAVEQHASAATGRRFADVAAEACSSTASSVRGRPPKSIIDAAFGELNAYFAVPPMTGTTSIGLGDAGFVGAAGNGGEEAGGSWSTRE